MLKLDTLVKIPFPVPTTMIANAGGVYTIPYTVEDNLIYKVVVTNGIDTLRYQNTCAGKYPSSIILTVLDTAVCKNSAPIQLTASANIPGTTQFFYINKLTGQRVNITQFDPSIFNANDTIYIKMSLIPTDITKCRTTIVQPVRIKTTNCCILPTLGTNTPALGTCTNGIVNNDAKIDFASLINADKAAASEGAIYTGVAYIAATKTVIGGAVSFTGLKHNTQYTFRIFNGDNTCFRDITITTPNKVCDCFNPPTAGTGTNPPMLCQAATGLASIDLFGQLTGETTGGTWVQTVGASVGTALNATTGIFNPNAIAIGTYTFRYTVTGVAPCPNDMEEISIAIQQCCPPATICVPMTITRN
jgi:hypothetical protein